MRFIKYENVWYKVGELIQIKVKRSFLFWYLPFFYKIIKCEIIFIGLDCSAKLIDIKTREERYITGSVKVL